MTVAETRPRLHPDDVRTSVLLPSKLPPWAPEPSKVRSSAGLSLPRKGERRPCAVLICPVVGAEGAVMVRTLPFLLRPPRLPIFCRRHPGQPPARLVPPYCKPAGPSQAAVPREKRMTDNSAGVSTILRSLHAARNNPTEAGHLLEDLVEFDDSVVGTLIAALDSPEPEVRSGAALALGYMPLYSDSKFDVAPALPALLGSASDNYPWAAFHASKSLWNVEVEDRGIDGLSEEAVSRVAKFLTNPEPGVRIAAAEMLGMTELAVPALIATLDDPVLEVRCAAADAIAKIGPAAVEAMPKLMAWTSSTVPEERFYGSAAVMALDTLHHSALAPVLTDALKHQDGGIRVKAVYALGRRSEVGNEAVPLLARLYRGSQDHELRLAVICVLAGLGAEVQDALPILIDAIRDPDREVAAAAARGLGVWGPAAAEAVNHLTARLHLEMGQKDTGSRREAESRCLLVDELRGALDELLGYHNMRWLNLNSHRRKDHDNDHERA